LGNYGLYFRHYDLGVHLFVGICIRDLDCSAFDKEVIHDAILMG